MEPRFKFKTYNSGVGQHVRLQRVIPVEFLVAVIARVAIFVLRWIVVAFVSLQVLMSFELLRTFLALKALRNGKSRKYFKVGSIKNLTVTDECAL